MKINKRADRGFYIAGWCGLILLLAWRCFTGFLHIPLIKYTWPCFFHAWTGYYCPGCGGTRAVTALLSGELLLSFRYHPLVFYTAAVGAWFMISQTIERISGGRLKIGMHVREIWLWTALGILTLNFIIKNLALAVWHVDLLL